MNTKQIFGLIMASILAAFSGTAGAVVHVDPGATGFNNGTSWENAYTSVKLAVDNSPAGSEIWVASGKYYPTLGTTDRTDSIALKSGMKLYGGFLPGMATREQRDWVAYPTILSGDINIVDNHGDNSDHILVGAPDAVVDGFTIERGGDVSFSAAQDGVDRAFGGGLLVTNIGSAVMKLENCTFKLNNTYYDDGSDRSLADGGAIYATTSALQVVSCIFESNSAQHKGGAVYIYNPEGSSSPAVCFDNCLFRGNFTRMGSGQVGGGAIWAAAGNLSVQSCEFIYNRGGINDLCYGFGAAIYTKPGGDGTDLLTVKDSIFTYNQNGSGQGGAIYAGRNALIEDSVFTQNRCHTRSRGGAIFVASGATADLFRCDFSGNFAIQNAHFYTWNMGGNLDEGQGAAIASEGTVNSVNCVFTGNFSASTESLELLGYENVPAETNYVDEGGGVITTNVTPAYVITNLLQAGGIKGGGGAFWQKPGSHGGSTFENCTFAGNRANKYGGAIFADNLTNNVELLNCISWGNEAWRADRAETDTYDEMYGDSITINYSDVAGGWAGTGANNMNADPLFGVSGAADGEKYTGTWTAKPTYDGTRGRATFTDANANWLPGELIGRFLEPTTNDLVFVSPTNWDGPANYTNIIHGLKFLIATNTATTITVYGDAREINYYWRATKAYSDIGHTYNIHDYHLKALGKRWTPLTPSTGRWARDSVHSPCIDEGDPSSDYSQELYPNGNRVNMGAYGNTPFASMKPEGLILMLR